MKAQAPLYHFELAEGQIHKLWPDVQGTGRLLMEIRDAATRQAALAIFDSQLGEVQGLAWQPDWEWWWQVDYFGGPYAVLSLFPQPEKPEKRGMQVYDTHTGTLLWSQPLYQFYQVDDQGQLWAEVSEGLIRAVDWTTGRLLSAAQPQDESIAPKSAWGSLVHWTALPQQYEEGQAYFHTVKNFLLRRYPEQPAQGVIHYLEWQGSVLIAWLSGSQYFLAAFSDQGHERWISWIDLQPTERHSPIPVLIWNDQIAVLTEGKYVRAWKIMS